MPGTGKTATTLEIIKRMRTAEFMKKNKLRPFDFIHINAMSLSNPNLVYSILHEKITGRKTNPTSSAAFLDEFFKKKDKQKVLKDRLLKGARISKMQQTKVRGEADRLRIVLVDELDALVTKKQTLLYNLFDWPCHS